MLTPDADPVRKVSIIPRGMALGVTLSTPDDDRVSYSREELAGQDQGRARRPRRRGARLRHDHHRRRIRHPAAHPDRPADGRTLGHERQARPSTILPADGQGYPGANDASPELQRQLEDEVHRIVEEAHVEVTQLLTDHRDQLDSLTHALLEAETLDAPDAYAAAGVRMRTAELTGAKQR